MRNLDKTERKIEMLKYLQGVEKRVGELAEYFEVDERTIRTDVDELREGSDFFGSKIKIESKHRGSQKHYYKSTVHPIFLGLNFTELFMLLKLLENNSKKFGGKVYEEIFLKIYSQMTEYAELLIAPKLEKQYSKTEIINTLEEESISKHNDYIFSYWYKSDRFIDISYLDENRELISEKARIKSVRNDELEIEGENGESRIVDFSEIVIDWSKVEYK